MNHKDEQLQRNIENNQPVEKSPDATAYRTIFDALKKEPYQLPNHFADSVVRRVEAGSKGLSSDYVWMGIGLFAFFLTAVVIAVLMKVSVNFGAFKFISGYGGLLVFGLLFILALQWVDKSIIRKNLQSNH
jgi:hypothetical protein